MKAKRALVTGATRGIGSAIAEVLAEQGMEVHITGTKELENSDYNYHKVDFLKPEEVDKFITKVRALEIDILINNAGINQIGEFEFLRDEDFVNIHTVNVLVPFKICKACIGHMKNRKWGRIVNVSSIFGKVTKEFRAAYSSSKFGIDGMTAALAVELAQFNILANCISPGFIDTDLTRRILGDKGIQELTQKIPMGRLGSVREIAEFVAWLVSSKNTYLTAQNIAIDGGFTRV